MSVGDLTISVHADVRGGKDSTFHRRACEGLVWLPEAGMGYLHVTQAPYDAEYFAKYEGYAATEMGVRITDARVALVRRWMLAGTLVDIGIGSGQFVETMGALSPLIPVHGFDINPTAAVWLDVRGLYLDPHRAPVDGLTFWDSIEHTPDAAALLMRAREWVFCSLPIVPGDGPPPKDWKHFRRDEHCWYWTRSGFIGWMLEQGFECVEHNTMESLLGREDIETFAFRRIR